MKTFKNISNINLSLSLDMTNSGYVEFCIGKETCTDVCGGFIVLWVPYWTHSRVSSSIDDDDISTLNTE